MTQSAGKYIAGCTQKLPVSTSEFRSLDVIAIAQLELSEYIEKQADKIAPEYEVDAILDIDFGSLYQVWLGSRLLGTFYRAAVDGSWIAQPYCSSIRYRLVTAKQAQQTIIFVSGLPLGNAV